MKGVEENSRRPTGGATNRVGHGRLMEQKNEWPKRGGSRIEGSKDACRRHRRVGIGELMRCMDNKYKVISIPRLVFQF